jgi:hypothetical protein
VFSNYLFDDVVKMNDKKHKDELDAGKAGNNQGLYSSISNKYNDSPNDKAQGVFAFVEDGQIGEFTKIFNATIYMKLDWTIATTWFKAILTGYEVALKWFTKPGKHKPNLYKFCQKRHQPCYYYPSDMLLPIGC